MAYTDKTSKLHERWYRTLYVIRSVNLISRPPPPPTLIRVYWICKITLLANIFGRWLKVLDTLYHSVKFLSKMFFKHYLEMIVLLRPQGFQDTPTKKLIQIPPRSYVSTSLTLTGVCFLRQKLLVYPFRRNRLEASPLKMKTKSDFFRVTLLKIKKVFFKFNLQSQPEFWRQLLRAELEWQISIA